MKNTHVLVAAFSSLLAQQVHAITQYQVTQIPLVSGAIGMGAAAINNSGEIAINAFFPVQNPTPGQNSEYSVPYLFSNDVYTPLQIPTGFVAGGISGINDNGDAVGSVNDAAGNSQPALWSKGTFTALPTGTFSYGGAYSINNQGQIGGEVFSSTDSPFPSDAVVWNSGALTDLGNYGATQTSIAHINNNGQALVKTYDATANHMSAIIQENTSEELLPDVQPRGTNANDINDLGQVVGTGPDIRGFLWENGNFTYLNPPSDAATAGATAINNLTQIVGYSSTTNDKILATLWESGQVYDLNSLIPSNSGWQLMFSQDISDNGDIIGYGIYQGGINFFLLTPLDSSAARPVPEPTSLTLLLCAALPLLKHRRS